MSGYTYDARPQRRGPTWREVLWFLAGVIVGTIVATVFQVIGI